jgi:hypothetical protein
MTNEIVTDSYSETVLDEGMKSYLSMNTKRIAEKESYQEYETSEREEFAWAQMLEISKTNLANVRKEKERKKRAINAELMREVNIWSSVTNEVRSQFGSKLGKLALGVLGVAVIFFAFTYNGTVEDVSADMPVDAIAQELVDEEFDGTNAPMPEGAPNAGFVEESPKL